MLYYCILRSVRVQWSSSKCYIIVSPGASEDCGVQVNAILLYLQERPSYSIFCPGTSECSGVQDNLRGYGSNPDLIPQTNCKYLIKRNGRLLLSILMCHGLK